jgi:hypothetical protein
MVVAMGSIIRLLAIFVSSIILLGFTFFAVDELDRGSKNQQQALANELEGNLDDPAPIAPTPQDEAAREAAHSRFREGVDDVNDVLLAPFVDVVESKDAWVNHGVPTLLGLLLYGVGLGFLANLLPKARTHSDDWRAAES